MEQPNLAYSTMLSISREMTKRCWAIAVALVVNYGNKKVLNLRGSPGLVVLRGDSCSEGYEFES